MVTSDLVDNIAIGIIALADGLWLECCMNPDRLSPEQAIESTVRFSLARMNNQESPA